MTGQEIINAVMTDIGRYQVLTTDTALRATILGWANRVLRDISGSDKHWLWLEKTASFDTVADQMTYDLPADIDLSGRKVYTLRQKTSRIKLRYIDQRRFDELEADPTASGTPVWYTLWANQLRLYPVPSAVITMYMRYLKTVTALADTAASTTDIPTKWDDVIIDGIKVHAFRMFPQWGNSTEQKAIYELGKARMAADNVADIDDDYISERHYSTNLIREPYSFDNEDM